MITFSTPPFERCSCASRRLCGISVLLIALFLGGFFSGCGRTTGEPANSTSKAETEAFAGVNQFWTVASLLDQGRSPSDEQWDALASSPGYKYYMADSPSAMATFKQRMRLVFAPEHRSALRDTIERARGQFQDEARTLHVLLAAKEHQKELKAFQESLSVSRLTRRAVEEAARLLPDGSFSTNTDQAAPLPIGVNIYNLAARSARDHFVVDLLMLRLLGPKGARLLLAHEAHHVGRVSKLEIPDAEQDPRYLLLQSIDDLQAEGIADLIDKPHSLKRLATRPSDLNVVGREWAQALLQGLFLQHKRAYESTPETLQQVDSLLVAAERADAKGNDEDLARISKQIARSIPNNGHPNGHYMATVIADQVGTNRLAETANNPFAFVELYNRAARKDDSSAQPFSQKTIKYLNHLEKKYISK